MTTPESHGPDISHHNPVANWDAIPQYRLFSTKATEGRTFRSPTFDENWEQMRRRRFEFRGCYHWIRSDSPMLDQVNNLGRAIDDHGGLQPGEFVQLDWETTPGIGHVSLEQVELWLTLAQRRWPGRIIVYCSDWVPSFTTWRERHPSYPLWYANYNTGNRPSGGWAECQKYNADVWQWTSSAPVPGIADPTVDMNHVFNWGTLARITQTAEEADMPKEYIAAPPAERPLMPWFLRVNGATSYATNGDDGYPIIPLNVEQYDWLYRSVYPSGPWDGTRFAPLEVKATNVPGGTPTFPNFTITGDITPT